MSSRKLLFPALLVSSRAKYLTDFCSCYISDSFHLLHISLVCPLCTLVAYANSLRNVSSTAWTTGGPFEEMIIILSLTHSFFSIYSDRVSDRNSTQLHDADYFSSSENFSLSTLASPALTVSYTNDCSAQRAQPFSQDLGTSGRIVIAFVDVMIMAAMWYILHKNGSTRFSR